MTFARLLAITTWRLCTRKRVWVLICLVAAGGAAVIKSQAHGPRGTLTIGVDGRGVVGSMYATGLTLQNLGLLGMIAAFALPLVLGDAFASDLAGRYIDLLRTRGVRKCPLFAAYTLSGVVASAMALTLVIVVWFIVATLTTPHLHGDISPMIAHDGLLLRDHPLMYFVAFIAITSVAAGAVLALCNTVGAATAWPSAAVVLPPVLLLLGYALPMLLSGLASPAASAALSPSERISWVDSGAQWASLASSARYWLAALLLTTLVGALLYAWREGP